MPYDGGKLHFSFADMLAADGVIGVPMKVLQAHKAEQVRLHPPGVMMTAKPYTLVGLIAFLGMLLLYVAVEPVTTFDVAFSLTIGVFVGLFSVVVMATISEMFQIKVLPKARWLEYPLHYWSLVPAPIREIGQIVARNNPGAKLIYGELTQEARVLDPYLVVQYRGERVCLGIWDDTGIIHMAEYVEP